MTKKKAERDPNATLATNRKARYDYFIEETMEAGMVLQGNEIKSLRHSTANLRDSYVVVRGREAWVRNLHITPYNQASTHEGEIDPLRPRKLLLHRRELSKLGEAAAREGMTLVPLRIYLKANRAKLEVGIAKGKKQYDKRETIADREAKRSLDRVRKSGSYEE